MKTLIRVQDSNGRGMFQAGANNREASVYEIDELWDLARRHSDLPTTRDDSVIWNYLTTELEDIFDEWEAGRHPYRFAFKSITQFEKWVKRHEVPILKEHGYRVVKVTVRDFDYVESEYQAIFDSSQVQSMEDITELFID